MAEQIDWTEGVEWNKAPPNNREMEPMNERLTPSEVKAKRKALQGRIKLSKTELTELLKKCEFCGAKAILVEKTGMCHRCVYGGE